MLSSPWRFRSAVLRRAICASSVAAVSVLPLAASAHHSFALFDTTKTVTIKGVVSRFEFTNPHVAIYVESGDPPKRFKVESGSVNALTRKGGWKPDSIKVGDKVEVTFNPLKTEEQPGGLLVEIKDGNAVLKGGG